MYHNVFGAQGSPPGFGNRPINNESSNLGGKRALFDKKGRTSNSLPSHTAPDFKRKVTFAGSDKDACSSMGLHQIDEDSDVENKPKSTNPSEKQMKKLEDGQQQYSPQTMKRQENKAKLPSSVSR